MPIFTIDFLNIDWIDKLNRYKDDANKALMFFEWQMNHILDKHMPYKKLSKKEYKRRYKPWITHTILNKIKPKHKKCNKYVHCKDETRKNSLNEDYKKIKNEVTESIRTSKKQYYNRYFQENKANMQKIWQGINEIINVKSKLHSVPSTIKSNDTTVSNARGIATCFNNYFTNIADDIIKDRKYSGKISYKKYLNNPFENSFALYDFDSKKISLMISTLNPRKGSGPNGLPTKILLMFKDELSLPLSIIFNISIKTGIFPDLLKLSKTIPVFKKGSKMAVENYRPISLLSNINKIFEKLMYNRVYKFLEDNKCLYDLQFGFRRKHSTIHALIQITEKIKSALDNGEYACGVFIDLQKAFDTVNHDILIEKLSHYGIRGLSKQWFKSYLTKRSQFVSIDGFNSSIMTVKHGVPQGSVLGPLLFLIYINDLYKSVIYSNAYHFADDTNLLVISKSQKQLQKHMNIDLKLLYKWLIANKISLNCTKTELIIFQGNRMDDVFDYKIKINGLKLMRTSNLKYLGVTVDNKLSGNYHCDILTGKLNRVNGMLSKVRHYVPSTELKSIYHALFNSHLKYGCQIWGLENTIQVKKIGKLQNKALRIINFQDWNTPSEPLYIQCQVLKLCDLVRLENCLFVHDYINNALPSCFADFFEKLKLRYTNLVTRNSSLGALFVPSVRTCSAGIHSVTFRSIQCWNHATKTLKTDLSKFSRHNLKIMLTKVFMKELQVSAL